MFPATLNPDTTFRSATTPQDSYVSIRPAATPPTPATPSKPHRDYYVQNDLPPLGTGDYGTVYRGYDRATTDPVAIKLIDKQRLKPEQLHATRHETKMLRQLPEHPHVLPLLGFGETSQHAYLVTPIVEGASLASVLRRGVRYDEDAARELLRNLLSAIAHLHKHGIMHRDIKAENVLLRPVRTDPSVPEGAAPPSTDPVLIDFGFATDEPRTSHVCGTPYYLAPEVIATARDPVEMTYDKACDVWSFGVLAYMVLQQGAKPFTGPSIEAVFRSSWSNRPPWHFPCPGAARDVVEHLLVTDCEERPTAAAALRHQWFAHRATLAAPAAHAATTDVAANQASRSTIEVASLPACADDPASTASLASFSFGCVSARSDASASGVAIEAPAQLLALSAADGYLGYSGGGNNGACSSDLSRFSRERAALSV